jgi:SPP1 gp7 family putative phage head morphogenesis protein
MPASIFQQLTRRALFGIRAARRIAQSVVKAPEGEKARSLSKAFSLERSRFEAHRRAAERRDLAADATKALSEVYGPVLSWRAILDEKTTPDCAFMNGRNFSVNDPPAVGLPGAVHPFCRCTAGPALAEGEIVTGATQVPS